MVFLQIIHHWVLKWEPVDCEELLITRLSDIDVQGFIANKNSVGVRKHPLQLGSSQISSITRFVSGSYILLESDSVASASSHGVYDFNVSQLFIAHVVLCPENALDYLILAQSVGIV